MSPPPETASDDAPTNGKSAVSNTGKTLEAIQDMKETMRGAVDALEDAVEHLNGHAVPAAPLKETSSERLQKIAADGDALIESRLRGVLTERCFSCQSPGGAVHNLGLKVEEALKALTRQQGRRDVWTLVLNVFTTVCIATLTLYGGYKLNQFRDIQNANRQPPTMVQPTK